MRLKEDKCISNVTKLHYSFLNQHNYSIEFLEKKYLKSQPQEMERQPGNTGRTGRSTHLC